MYICIYIYIYEIIWDYKRMYHVLDGSSSISDLYPMATVTPHMAGLSVFKSQWSPQHQRYCCYKSHVACTTKAWALWWVVGIFQSPAGHFANLCNFSQYSQNWKWKGIVEKVLSPYIYLFKHWDMLTLDMDGQGSISCALWQVTYRLLGGAHHRENCLT